MFFDWFRKERPHPDLTSDSEAPDGGSPAPPEELPLELVARRAYEIWCRKGRPTHSQVPDWLAAEAELRRDGQPPTPLVMTLALRHRPVPPSRLARWDARWKLSAILLAVVGVASLDRLDSTLLAFLAALGLVALARLPGQVVRTRLGVLALAVVPFLLVVPFTLDPVGPGFDLGPLHASEHGFAVAAAVALRCLAVGCLGLVLLGTAPVHHTLAAAHRIGFPGVLTQLALLAYRYAFLLADELRRLRIALRVRGFRARADGHSYRTFGHVTGALLVRGADRAEHVAEAMRCRGFDGTFHTLAGFRTTPADVLSFLALAAGTIALVAWDRLAVG